MAITNNNGVSFEGCVLTVYNRDYQAMSDVYTYATFAKVWSFETRSVREVLVNANFECDQNNGRATVDATPEVLIAVMAWEAAQEAARVRREEIAREASARAEALKPQKGRIVEVFKGRKIPLGTKGFVFWEGTDRYGNAKIGIATTNRKVQAPGKRFASFVDVVFVAASNCRAIPNQTEALAAFENG